LKVLDLINAMYCHTYMSTINKLSLGHWVFSVVNRQIVCLNLLVVRDPNIINKFQHRNSNSTSSVLLPACEHNVVFILYCKYSCSSPWASVLFNVQCALAALSVHAQHYQIDLAFKTIPSYYPFTVPPVACEWTTDWLNTLTDRLVFQTSINW